MVQLQKKKRIELLMIESVVYMHAKSRLLGTSILQTQYSPCHLTL